MDVPWQVPVLLGLVTMAVNPILIKRATGLPSRTRRLVWQFGFAACFSLTLALVMGEPLVSASIAIVAVIGFVNSWGAYCQWRAVDISVSRTYLFTQADDLIAMALGYAILREHEHLSASSFLATGVVIAIAGGTAIAVTRYRNAATTPAATPRATIPTQLMTHAAGVSSGDGRSLTPGAEQVLYVRSALLEFLARHQLACWIAMYSVIWGIADFSKRYFALEGVSTPSFLVGWYGGAFLGANVIRFSRSRAEAGAPLDARGSRGMFLLGVTIWVALLLSVWAQHLAPITVVQPIRQVSEMVIPTIIGLTVFKEGVGLGVGGYVRFGIGIVGCAIILVVF